MDYRDSLKAVLDASNSFNGKIMAGFIYMLHMKFQRMNLISSHNGRSKPVSVEAPHTHYCHRDAVDNSKLLCDGGPRRPRQTLAAYHQRVWSLSSREVLLPVRVCDRRLPDGSARSGHLQRAEELGQVTDLPVPDCSRLVLLGSRRCG